MPALTAVIFDLGQVLVRWDPTRAFAPELSEQEARAAMQRMDFGEFNLRLDTGESYERVRADLAERHPGDVHLLDRYRERMAATVLGPVPGTAEIVHALRDAGIGVFGLTNWSATSFHLAEPAAPVIGLLSDIVVSGQCGLSKPDPRVFEYAIDRFGVTPATTLFVDDTARNLEPAAAHGLLTHLFTDAGELRRHLSDLGVEVGEPR